MDSGDVPRLSDVAAQLVQLARKRDLSGISSGVGFERKTVGVGTTGLGKTTLSVLKNAFSIVTHAPATVAWPDP